MLRIAIKENKNMVSILSEVKTIIKQTLQIWANYFEMELTIDVPLNLSYSDAFNISGTLIANLGGLSGQTVKLKVGNTVVDTTTTGNDGNYSFTQTPVTTGNHTFQVIFEGSGKYGAVESATVTREVGKETTIITLDTIGAQEEGNDVPISGSLLSDDGEPLANASIKIFKDGTQVDTVTTDSNGEFSSTFYASDWDGDTLTDSLTSNRIIIPNDIIEDSDEVIMFFIPWYKCAWYPPENPEDGTTLTYLNNVPLPEDALSYLLDYPYYDDPISTMTGVVDNQNMVSMNTPAQYWSEPTIGDENLTFNELDFCYIDCQISNANFSATPNYQNVYTNDVPHIVFLVNINTFIFYGGTYSSINGSDLVVTLNKILEE